MSVINISNRDFRRALLCLNGLTNAPENDPLPSPATTSGSEWLTGMVDRLSFVQIDTVAAIERAHHHILFSRNPKYQKEWLKTHLEEERSLFENWTHDAAILPIDVYPHWKHYFERVKTFEAHPEYKNYYRHIDKGHLAHVQRQIRENGPLKLRDMKGIEKAKHTDQSPFPLNIARMATEMLWRNGVLAIAGREGNQRVFDLAERVIPERHYNAKVSKKAYIDRACREALLRLGAASATQIARFHHAVSRDHALAWCKQNLGKAVVQVTVTHVDGGTVNTPLYALTDVLDTLPNMPAAPKKLRLLNPFDPLIHDRQRTERIFGFDYRIEIFVPQKKRTYGYYVLPILEGERFTGRVDAKADRKKGELTVLGLWWEDGVKPTKAREEQLEKALLQLGAFAGATELKFARGYKKSE